MSVGDRSQSPISTRLALKLGRHSWLHSLVASLRLYPIAEVILRVVPLSRRLRPSGLVYRVSSLDQLSSEYEMFVHESYRPALGEEPVRTFIDLGCNAGWFALWLTSTDPTLNRQGLLIDAHPKMVQEARWHIERNGLKNCFVVHGAVGLQPGQVWSSFYVHPSSSASSVLPYQPGRQVLAKGRIRETVVRAVSVADEWRSLFGGAAVDLMKVDIEGKERDFVTYEAQFIQACVRGLVIEWHKWCTSLAELDDLLKAIGFDRKADYDENKVAGIAVYRNATKLFDQDLTGT